MTRTKMTPEEKKTRAEAKKQSNLTIIARGQFKTTGAVLFAIEDRNGKEPAIMHVTVIAGKVTGCHNTTTGEECSGRHWAKHCCHGDRVMAYEAKRAEQLHEAEVIAPLVLGEQFAADLPAHVEDTPRRYTHECISCCQCSVCKPERERRDAMQAEIDAKLAAEKRAAFDQVVAQVRAIESGSTDMPDSIEAKRAAWQQATEEQRRNWFCDEFDIYGAA